MQRIGFVALPGFQVLSVGALSVFEHANKEMDEPAYEVRLFEAGGSIRSSIGINVETEPFDDSDFDTLIVGGSAVWIIDTRRNRIFAPGSSTIPAGRCDVRRGVHPGRSRSARW